MNSAEFSELARESETLPAAVLAQKWRYLRSGEDLDFAREVATLVLGVETWDEEEVRALALLASVEPLGTEVVVFDLDRMEGPSAVSRAIPGAPFVRQSPVVALYIDGVLKNCSQGPEGISVIAQMVRSWKEARTR